MARKLRVECPGAIYHVMNRGDRRELIFKNDLDREWFLETLGEACAKAGWQVYAYVLMPNHFHLVVETPQPNLVAGMKWLLGTYTRRFNRRHKLFGHLFSGRYKSLIVDGSGRGYLKRVCDYMHLNPARAKLVAADAPLKHFAWSSWPAYLLAPAKRPAWLRGDRLLGEYQVSAGQGGGLPVRAAPRQGRRMLAQAARRGWGWARRVTRTTGCIGGARER
jgi:REP element-mobilizing transposase RayT